MNIKAAGFWVALVLTLGPALIAFLHDASGQGWVDAGTAGVAILVINGLVKFIQVYRADAQPQVLPTPSASPMPMASPMPEQPKESTRLKTWLAG